MGGKTLLEGKCRIQILRWQKKMNPLLLIERKIMPTVYSEGKLRHGSISTTLIYLYFW